MNKNTFFGFCLIFITLLCLSSCEKENAGDDPTTHVIYKHQYKRGLGKDKVKAVDLGLPSGLKWASVNLGAENPWEHGDYFAWAAVEPWIVYYEIVDYKYTNPDVPFKWNPAHDNYNWTNTPYNISGAANDYRNKCWTKYTNNLSDYTADGYLDSEDAEKIVLDEEDDAAVYQWGDGWRMPTSEEQEELRYNAYWVWTNNYKDSKHSGYIVYKAKKDADKGVLLLSVGLDKLDKSYNVKTDAHIFLPLTGVCKEGSYSLGGSVVGRYWSSTLGGAFYTEEARDLDIDAAGAMVGWSIDRCYGNSIRAVKP